MYASRASSLFLQEDHVVFAQSMHSLFYYQ